MEQRLSDDLEHLDLHYPDAPPANRGADLGDFIPLFPMLGRWELRAIYGRCDDRWELERRIGPLVEQYDYDEDETVTEFVRYGAEWVGDRNAGECAPEETAESVDRNTNAGAVEDAATVSVMAADYGFFYYPDQQRLYIDRPFFYDSGELDWVWTDCYLVRMLAPGRAVLYDLCDDRDFVQCCRAYLLDRIDDPALCMVCSGEIRDRKS